MGSLNFENHTVPAAAYENDSTFDNYDAGSYACISMIDYYIYLYYY